MGYLDSLHRDVFETHLKPLRDYAAENDVPIISTEGARFLRQLIDLVGARRILELGTAIGYSALLMRDMPSVSHITTIERDEHMVSVAREYFARFDTNQTITLIEGDALEVSMQNDEVFDMIFIDAAKAQSIKLFEKFEPYLVPGGVIVTDNALFLGLHEASIKNRNLKQLVRKIDAFNHYALNRDDFHSVCHPIGDGMIVSKKIG